MTNTGQASSSLLPGLGTPPREPPARGCRTRMAQPQKGPSPCVHLQRDLLVTLLDDPIRMLAVFCTAHPARSLGRP